MAKTTERKPRRSLLSKRQAVAPESTNTTEPNNSWDDENMIAAVTTESAISTQMI